MMKQSGISTVGTPNVLVIAGIICARRACVHLLMVAGDRSRRARAFDARALAPCFEPARARARPRLHHRHHKEVDVRRAAPRVELLEQEEREEGEARVLVRAHEVGAEPARLDRQ